MRYVSTLVLALLVSVFVSGAALAWPLPEKFNHYYPPGLQKKFDEKFQGYPFTPPGLQKNTMQEKEPQPTEPDGTLPPLEELPVSEEPYVNPNVPAPGEEHEPHVVAPPAFEGGGKVHVYNGPVLYYVQNFANNACNRFAACTVSTYVGHPPARNRALDFLIARQWGMYAQGERRLRGTRVANFALNNRGHFSVSYVIWRNRIAGHWSGYKWEAYGGVGAMDGHYDHVHVGFKSR